MYVNINKLKGKFVELGLSVPDVAHKIGMDPSTLYRKMADDGRTMLVKDANEIVKVLDLSAADAMAIFFSQFVA